MRNRICHCEPRWGEAIQLCGLAITLVALVFAGCATPSRTAKEQALASVERMFTADANQAYYAIRWALAATGYPVGTEDLRNGTISTTWVPTQIGAQYLDPFDRNDPGSRDWGNRGGYFRMDIQVIPEDGKVRIIATERVRSIIANLRSSGEQEERVLNKIGDYLRNADPDVTNVSVPESMK